MFGVDDPCVEAAVRAYVKLLRATRCVIARIEPGLAAHSLTPTQLGVLEAILHKGPLGQRALGRKLLTSPGNMSDVIDKLARRGLVRREANPQDRRQVDVSLTEDGRALISAVFPLHARDIAAAMGGLDREETEALGRLLRKLGRAAEAEAEKEGTLAVPDCPPHVPAQSFDTERSWEREQDP